MLASINQIVKEFNSELQKSLLDLSIEENDVIGLRDKLNTLEIRVHETEGELEGVERELAILMPLLQ